MKFENGVMEMKLVHPLHALLYHYCEFQHAIYNLSRFPGHNYSIKTVFLQKLLVVSLIKIITCWKTSKVLPEYYFDSVIKV